MTENKIETLNKRLKEISEKFDALKESGIDSDILEIYLSHKTRLTREEVKKLLNSQEEFYDKLIKKEILKSLEEKNAN